VKHSSIQIDASDWRALERGHVKAERYLQGRRLFAKSNAAKTEPDDEPRLCVEGLGLEFDTLIANKIGEIIIFEPTAFDDYFASGKRPEFWIGHDKDKVVGGNVELAILNEGVAFRFELPNTTHGIAVKDSVLSGEQTGISVGFTELNARDEIHFGRNVHRILEASIREVSVVPRGASKKAFCRIIDANREPRLGESVNTVLFGIEHDLHNIKVLVDDNDFAIRTLKRNLLLLQDGHHGSDEPIKSMTVNQSNRLQTEQYETFRAQRRAVLLGM
jgi:HK97 family phage prohead protease